MQQHLKRCSRCGQQKPQEEFYARKRSVDGRQAWCKTCMRSVTREWFGAPGRAAAVKAAWRAENPELNRETQRQWQAANSERVETYSLKWRLANPDVPRHQARMRRARIRNAGGSYTIEEMAALFARQGGRCANPYCRCEIDMATAHRDHDIPIARGGSNSIGNMRWLCQPCNQRKGAKMPDVWQASEARRYVKQRGLL